MFCRNTRAVKKQSHGKKILKLFTELQHADAAAEYFGYAPLLPKWPEGKGSRERGLLRETATEAQNIDGNMLLEIVGVDLSYLIYQLLEFNVTVGIMLGFGKNYRNGKV